MQAWKNLVNEFETERASVAKNSEAGFSEELMKRMQEFNVARLLGANRKMVQDEQKKYLGIMERNLKRKVCIPSHLSVLNK